MPNNARRTTQLIGELSAPLGDLIAAVGRGVAEAQQAIDQQTIEHFRAIYAEDGHILEALRRIGYQPTWYHIPEAAGELHVALTISGEHAQAPASRPAQPALGGASLLARPAVAPRFKLYAAPTDAGYNNRYDYKIEASSSINFKIVPVPPSPAAAEMRVVPALVGRDPPLTYETARQLLNQLDVPFTIAGDKEPEEDATLKRQTPEAGEILLGGQPVELEF